MRKLKTLSNQWLVLWQRWINLEVIWQTDKRAVLLRLLSYSKSNCEKELNIYIMSNLPQPTKDELDTFWFIFEQIKKLDRLNFPLPDVYAAACWIKSSEWAYRNRENNEFSGFRGQRNADWDVMPSIFRNLPKNRSLKQMILEERRHSLAVFCEAIRKLYYKNKKIGDINLIAIAQHYGIPSPLIDLSFSPWVALFFASDGGQDGDIGVVQNFSLPSLEELLNVENRFGCLKIVTDVDFVRRIKNQQGFFIEQPIANLAGQIIPSVLTFEQHGGLVFEEELLGVTHSNIYPNSKVDELAYFSEASLKDYPVLNVPSNMVATDYFKAAMSWQFGDKKLPNNKEVIKSVKELCIFHTLLQKQKNMPNYQRSITRFRTALGHILSGVEEGRIPSLQDHIRYYESQAFDSGLVAIDAVKNLIVIK